MATVLERPRQIFAPTATGYQIEKNVPIPPRRRGREPGPLKYPFLDMGIGDSFYDPAAGKTLPSYVSATGRRLGMKFTTRVIVGGGYRVWRIA